MIFKSEIVTQASGSIGGVTYARAKGGTLYRRARAIPVNPNTPNQTQVRTALTQLVTYWSDTMSSSNRESWNLYAQNVPTTNKLGSAIHLSGQNWFIACNTPKIQAQNKGLASVAQTNTAPSIFDRGNFDTPTSLSITVANGIDFDFDDLDEWATTDQGYMYIYMGRPRGLGRSFFKGPYRLVGVISGNTSSPPTSPFTISAGDVSTRGWPLVTGQIVRVEVAVSQPDGRLSTRRSLGDVQVTPT